MPRASIRQNREDPGDRDGRMRLFRGDRMNPGTSFHFFHRGTHGESSSTTWAAIIAILFSVIAAVSFAVDQSITLSSLPAPPPPQAVGR
jgi:hypothetical protein